MLTCARPPGHCLAPGYKPYNPFKTLIKLITLRLAGDLTSVDESWSLAAYLQWAASRPADGGTLAALQEEPAQVRGWVGGTHPTSQQGG